VNWNRRAICLQGLPSLQNYAPASSRVTNVLLHLEHVRGYRRTQQTAKNLGMTGTQCAIGFFHTDPGREFRMKVAAAITVSQ
jgi:hypothetical protein